MAAPKKLASAIATKASSSMKNASFKRGGGKKEQNEETLDVMLEEFLRAKTLLKPDDQLDIPEADLKEDVTRFLLSVDTRAPKDVVEYSFKEGKFVQVPAPPPTVMLVHLESSIILKDSPEGQAQIAAGDWGGEEEPVIQKATKKSDEDEEEEPVAAGQTEGEGEAVAEDEDEKKGDRVEKDEEEVEKEPETGTQAKDAASSDAPKKGKKLLNAFNFCERGALTYNNPFRDMACQTIPLPRSIFCGVISGWMIYDFYAEDYERQLKEKEKERKIPLGAVKGKESDKKMETMLAEAFQMKMNEAAKIIDRMICQNVFDDISNDYRYYEDPSDEYRNEEGTLLPLWKFCYEKTKKLTVTEMQWNPQYYDLFAVTFGSYDFSKQPSPGGLCLFTLKNPSYPEYIRLSDVSFMSLSIHTKHAYLIAVGKYDGNIAIYNTSCTDKLPQYQSNSVTNKHLGPVWQVRWGMDLEDGELNVFSISCDGKINNWLLMQSELVVTTVITLTLPINQIAGPDGALVSITASASAIAFHPINKKIYLVGTEEGKIFKCSSLYRAKYLFSYEGHTMPVHKISFNRYLPVIFLSCSSDWTVKIWEDTVSTPLFCFDLSCSVADAQWAPYSSSVLAAVTVDGKCHVFDLNVNKYKAICTQSVVSRKGKNRISRIKFNYHMPILIIGDERGTITTLKLSPNLRLKAKQPKKKDVQLDQTQLEILKLERVLSVVREPPVLVPPPDKESV